jgi:radical SAM/Cys-rich protein
MPCYLEENVRAQRGAGVYGKSVACLRLLNEAGYGTEDGLPLALVYNPGGEALPGSQGALEAAYRAELAERFGIVFTRLYTIANIPVGRFGEALDRGGRRGEYLARLRAAFNPGTVAHLMCRRQVCVDWDGRLYDCDFNLALGRPVGPRAPDHVSRFDPAELLGRDVETGEHCYACTAGAGSSCGGALAQGEAVH